MDFLPNEIRLNIFRNFDLHTALQFLRLERKNDNDLIYQCLKFDVGIKVEYLKTGFMVVELFDVKTKIAAVMWHIKEICANRTTIRQMDSTGKSLYCTTMKKTRFSDAAFQIVGRIFSKTMFRVKKLYLNFSKFRGNVKFGKPIDDLEELHLFDCNEGMLKKIRTNFEKFPRRLFSDIRNGYQNPPDEFIIFKMFGTSEVYFGLTDVLETHNFFENGLQELKNRDGSINENGIGRLINILLHGRPNNNSKNYGFFWITSEAPGSSSNYPSLKEYKSYDSVDNNVHIITVPNSDSILGAVQFGFIY